MSPLCRQNMNTAGLPEQLILLRLHRHDPEERNAALLCSHCLYLLVARASYALVIATVGAVSVKFGILVLLSQGRGGGGGRA